MTMSGDLYYRVSVSASGASYDLSDDLSSLTVDQHEGQPDSLTVEIADPYKVLGHALQEGMDVEVELGTDDDHAIVFRGRIYKLDGSFPGDAAPSLKLQAYDGRMRMGLRQRNRVFADRALSSIVREVARPYFNNMQIDVEGDPTFPGNGTRQQDESDLAFLIRLAEAYGCVMYVTAEDRGDIFHFIAQYKVMKTQPVVTVYYGRTGVEYGLRSFQSNMDTAQIQLPRTISGIDYDTGEATEIATAELLDAGDTDDAFFDENFTEFRASQPDKAASLERLLGVAEAAREMLRVDLGTSVRTAVPTFTTEAQQRAIADNQFSTSLRGMRGSGTADGIRKLVAQTSVEIRDVGGRFSGTWFLSQVRHVLDEKGYRSEFECRR
jgi:phage protein D